MLIIAAIDYAWQKHTHTQSLRMTLKEVKDESKQTEGRRRCVRRSAGCSISRRRNPRGQREALDNVGDATAVITNPTHFAVALNTRPARRVRRWCWPWAVARWRCRSSSGDAARVRTVRIPMLARALYFTSEIGGEIAEGLYNAVAVVLAYVFRIDSGESLEMPDLTLPPDLRFDENGNLETEGK